MEKIVKIIGVLFFLIFLSSCLFDAVRNNSNDPNAAVIITDEFGFDEIIDDPGGSTGGYSGILSTDYDTVQYYPNNPLTIFLDDLDLTGLSTVTVDVWTDSFNTAVQSITLTSSNLDGYFTGTVTAVSATPVPGQVQTSSSENMYIKYHDANPARAETIQIYINPP